MNRIENRADVKTAVVAAAGQGTRMGTWTEQHSKEILPIYDAKDKVVKPAIEFLLQELEDSAIDRVIIIINQDKQDIKPHVDFWRKMAKLRGAEVPKIIGYVDQSDDFSGNAAPLLTVRDLVEKNPVYYAFPDDLYRADRLNVREQMTSVYRQTGTFVLALHNIKDIESEMYGVVTTDGEVLETNGIQYIRVSNVVEKQPASDADRIGQLGRLAVAGRYIVTPNIWFYLDNQLGRKNQEINLSVAAGEMAREFGDGMAVVGAVIEGRYEDVGTPESFVTAQIRETLAYASQNPRAIRAILDAASELYAQGYTIED